MNKENKFFPILNINEKTDREQVPWGKGEKNSDKKVKRTWNHLVQPKFFIIQKVI